MMAASTAPGQLPTWHRSCPISQAAPGTVLHVQQVLKKGQHRSLQAPSVLLLSCMLCQTLLQMLCLMTEH